MTTRRLSPLLAAFWLAAWLQPGAVAADDAPETRPRRQASSPSTSSLPVEDPSLSTARPEDQDQVPSHDLEILPDEKTPSVEDAAETTGTPAEQTTDSEPAAEQVEVDYRDALVVGVNDWFFLSLNGLVQGRYTLNYRTDRYQDPASEELDDHITQGFDVARARFTLGVGLTEFVALVMRLGVVAGGDFEFQRAFIDLKWKQFRLRTGLFMNELLGESLINPTDLLFLDYSIVENVYTPGSSKGIMMTYLLNRFSVNVGYSDGLRTGFSEIRSPSNADYAITLRTQYAWGEKQLLGFNRLSARRGTPFGIRLGGAFHYQDGGHTQGSLPARIMVGTVDVSTRGDGWSAFFAGVVAQDAAKAATTQEAGEVFGGGVTLMGGYFVLQDLQLFGQYSIVSKPKFRGVVPPDLEDIERQPSNFQAFGIGASYYVIPGFDNVKVSTDFQYFVGSERGSLVPVSPLNSIQVNDAGSQFAWRLQISGAF